MFDGIKKMLGEEDESGQNKAAGGETHDIRLAVCALLMEMANIDGEFTGAERDLILATLKDEYGLEVETANELMTAAAAELEQSIDLWTFTNVINKRFSEEEKIKVVEMLWRVLYSDGILDKHEDYLVRKLSRLLRLNLRKLVEAKRSATGLAD